MFPVVRAAPQAGRASLAGDDEEAVESRFDSWGAFRCEGAKGT